MKKTKFLPQSVNIKSIVTTLLISLAVATASMAQPPPPPGGGGSGPGNNNSENQTGGNAPIGSGSIILLSLAAAYAGKKVFGLTKKESEKIK